MSQTRTLGPAAVEPFKLRFLRRRAQSRDVHRGNMSPLVLFDSHNRGTPGYVRRDSRYRNEHPIRSMNTFKVDWNRTFEFAWRILVFIVAVGTIAVVSTNWTRWEGAPGWQRTNDAYLQADLTPISAKVRGYGGVSFRFKITSVCTRAKFLRNWLTMTIAPRSSRRKPASRPHWRKRRR